MNKPHKMVLKKHSRQEGKLSIGNETSHILPLKREYNLHKEKKQKVQYY
jgi:hypothetical protein